jgi:hypothetical protein
MKKIFTILFCCLVLFGCKKNIFDYRSKFVGDYNFTVQLSTVDIYNQTADSTYFYKGKIWYDGNETCVSIDFSGYRPEIVKLYEDGSMKSYYVNGEFESTKKVKFNVFYNNLGGSGEYSIVGDKAK